MNDRKRLVPERHGAFKLTASGGVVADAHRDPNRSIEPELLQALENRESHDGPAHRGRIVVDESDDVLGVHAH